MLDRENIWRSVLAEVELTTSRASFITWFKETSIADMNDGVITVSVPNGFAKNWLQDKYHKAILRALRNIAGDTREVHYVVGMARQATHLRAAKPRPPVRTQ